MAEEAKTNTVEISGQDNIQEVETQKTTCDNAQPLAEENNSPRKIDNLERALRNFKRSSASILAEVRKREAYDSPSVKRKKKSKEARRHKKNNYSRSNRNY